MGWLPCWAHYESTPEEGWDFRVGFSLLPAVVQTVFRLLANARTPNMRDMRLKPPQIVAPNNGVLGLRPHGVIRRR